MDVGDAWLPGDETETVDAPTWAWVSYIVLNVLLLAAVGLQSV